MIRPLLCALLLILPAAAGAAPPIETIVMIRHGEKQPAGLGQLDCRGLNRALALPAVLARRFGRPAAIFAPDPAARKPDGAAAYDYLRPLATIEPTAIALGLPVDTDHGYADLAGLQAGLLDQRLTGATVFVAWEHHQLIQLARALLTAKGGDPATVRADWPQADYDSIYVVTITAGVRPTARFDLAHEGLDQLSDSCPG